MEIEDATHADDPMRLDGAEREIIDYETVVVACLHSGCKWREEADFSERRAAVDRGRQHWEREHGTSDAAAERA